MFILLENFSCEWTSFIKNFNNGIDNIFTNRNYLTNKDKILIIINYLTLIKYPNSGQYNYRFKSFYDLNEESSYVKSELLYRKIIFNLKIDSSLFFIFAIKF